MSGSTTPTTKIPWRQKFSRLLSSKSSVPPATLVPGIPASTVPTPPPPPVSAPSSTVTSTAALPAASSTSPSLTTNNPTLVRPSSPATSVITQLLQNTLQRLNDEERATIARYVFSSIDIQSVVEDAVKAAKSKRQACLDKRWSVTIGGRDVVLREKADKVVHWLDRFKPVGDVVANADPVHIGLPWAGIRLLLEVAVAESHQMAALLVGCEVSLYMASRLQVYVEFWHRLPVTAARNNLEESMVVMYAHILHFLAQAIHTYNTSTVHRTLAALWKIDDTVNFETKGNDLATKVEVDASNCDRGQLQQNMQQALVELQQLHQLQASLDHLHTKIDLNKIPYAKGAVFNSFDSMHTPCHPATRRDILSQVQTWAQQPDGKGIFWLYGGAGAGKSTISWTIAQWLTESGSQGGVDHGASFFFKRGEGDRGSTERFFPTIIRQLVTKVPGLDVLVAKAVDSDPFIFDKALAEQFRRLLLQPLQDLSMFGGNQTTTLVVVVDALDECEKEIDVRTILQLWSQLSRLTGVRLRLFLTSRPELPIRLEFQRMSIDRFRDIDLVDTVPLNTIQHDLSVYLDDTLCAIREEYNHRLFGKVTLSKDWPGNETIQQLVDLAKPLFIVAATICRFTGDLDFNPRDNLEKFLRHRSIGQMSQMEATYLPVLNHLINQIRDNGQAARLHSEFRMIVGSIILLADPLSIPNLAYLLGISTESIDRRLAPLHSVLRVPADDHSPIRSLHLSFAEFLLSDKARQQPFGIDGSGTHLTLSRHCLRVLSGPNGLRENICDLDHPGQPKHEVESITITSRLSLVLQYACRYWVHHVQHSHYQIQDGDAVHSFLQRRFLHWLEALSLIDRLSDAISLVGILQLCVSPAASEVSAFLEDARRFILANRSIANFAPLQLYSSAIVFTPHNSLVREICGQVPRWIQQHPRTRIGWGAELQKLEGHSDSVNTVAFSPDGRLLASGSEDKTIRLWDTQTGGEVQKLEGHSDSVNTVAFSPDGRLLASGSFDKTIRLWDTQTGGEVQKLEGHSHSVNTVAFSPDGRLLASGSWDETIRLWDTQTGGEVQKLEGHSDSVNTVAFSPDGRLLASGAWDETIRLWDTQTGQMVSSLENIPPSVFIRVANNNTMLITDKGVFNIGDGGIPNVDSIEPDEDRMISVSDEWIRQGGQKLLWLPHEYRGRATFHGNKLAIGASSGLVSIFQFLSF